MNKQEQVAQIIDAIVRERDAARTAGNYELADKLRNSLDKFALEGWQVKLEDSKTGTLWHWSRK